jgi:hypothetical protein
MEKKLEIRKHNHHDYGDAGNDLSIMKDAAGTLVA